MANEPTYEELQEKVRSLSEKLEDARERILALTQPIEMESEISFFDLFALDDIQRLQDEFARATGVASIITRPDGTPLTAPSNFCRLCSDIIRNTEKGRANCFKSDAVLGRYHPEGPIIQPCLSGGLWDAGAAISVGGKHIANWLIGQVRNEAQSEGGMREYAREIGADETEVLEAFGEVPSMSREQFTNVAQVLFTLASQLSAAAYQNVQQARFITERQRAEETLQAREAFWNQIMDQSPFATWIADAEGTLLQANPALKRILNLTDEQLVGKYNLFQDPLLDRQGLIPLVRSVYEEGRTIHFTCDWDGNDIPELDLTGSNAVSIEATIFPIHGPESGVTHAVINWIDVTEKKQARKALQEIEQRFKAILEASPDPVVVYGIEGHPRFLNPAFTEVFGWTLEELRGQRIPFVPEDQQERTRTAIENLFRSGKAVRFQSKRLTKQGGTIDVIISAAIIKGPEGQASGMVVNLTDISAQKKLEAQLQQAQKLESVGRLAGGVAHDFNNMLSIIRGNTEMAMEDLDGHSPITGNLQEIQKAAERSTDLTRQLLAFARKQTIAPKVLDLNEAIEAAIKMIRRLIGEDIQLSWQPAGDLWPVRVDPSQLDQMLANLCVNARDAIDGVGKITIQTGKATFDAAYCEDHPDFMPGHFVMMAVRDDGSGMNRETLNNLFDPFFTTKGMDKGTGLGLATVYGVVKQNNGFIHVSSEPEHGSTFRVYLPRHGHAAPPLPGKKTVAADAGGRETILLVEDEPSILGMTKMMLQRLGYTVLPAATPEEGIRMARSHGGDIHLLMTDVIMPVMNGRDLARQLISIYPDLKCLFMSGYTANVIAHHGVLDAGVNFIQKPFTKQGLSVKVRETLEKNQERQ